MARNSRSAACVEYQEGLAFLAGPGANLEEMALAILATDIR